MTPIPKIEPPVLATAMRLNYVYFLPAFVCPEGFPVVVVEQGNIGLDLDIPGSGVNPNDAVTSDGVDLLPTESFEVTSPDGNTFIVMDVEFEVLGADTVTVTFIIPDGTNEVLEVGILHQFVCNFMIKQRLVEN